MSGAPERLVALQEFAAFEGAWLLLARLKAHRPDVSTEAVVTSIPADCQLSDFFGEVREAARMVPVDSDLDVSIE